MSFGINSMQSEFNDDNGDLRSDCKTIKINEQSLKRYNFLPFVFDNFETEVLCKV